MKVSYICDEMLQKLARWLRIAGYDVLSPRDLTDAEIADMAIEQGRVLLTRDKDLARMKGPCSLRILSEDLDKQLEEVFRIYSPRVYTPENSRCPVCNGTLEVINREKVDNAAIFNGIPEKVIGYHDVFFRCRECGKIYWIGKHWDRIKDLLSRFGIDPIPDQWNRNIHL
jgi:uncharacterized protein with PIN domain